MSGYYSCFYQKNTCKGHQYDFIFGNNSSNYTTTTYFSKHADTQLRYKTNKSKTSTVLTLESIAHTLSKLISL